MNKIITLQEAAEMVLSEATLALGGLTLYRRPVAFCVELLRRARAGMGPRDLTLLAFTAGYESDLLVGGGLVRQVRSCYFGLEIFGLAPMFTYYANRGELEILEESEASLAFGLRAQMAGIGFMPGRGWIGTDLPRLRPDVKTVLDPYSGEELMAFPAIRPDVAVVHALKADREGNALIGKNRGVDEELALTADVVIVTTEVMEDELEEADLAAPMVHAVVLAPGGALPTSCHPYYPMDGEKLLAYTEQVGEPEGFERYLEHLLAES
jgi:glutaconate CoA-transferase, subunit A